MGAYDANYTAISTYKVYLMKGTGSSGSITYSKLVDVKSIPDLGGTPEMLETTTMSDPMQTNIAGIQTLDALEFTANYNKTDFTTLKALEGTTGHYAVYFGENGTDGKFIFDGQLSVFANGGGVNEVVDMTITIAASTKINFE